MTAVALTNKVTMYKSAIISDCKKFRYSLARSWLVGKGRVTWIMLNPSTADDSVDDPTIRRCINFTKRMGRQEILVVNLFALRATDPKELLKAADPVGLDNLHWLQTQIGAPWEAQHESHSVMAAWGTLSPKLKHAAHRSLKFIQERTNGHLQCLGKTKWGDPRHPLYLRSDSECVPYEVVL